MENRKLRKVIISGDPYSRGVQYGEKAKDLIKRAIEIYHKLFLESAGVPWAKATDFAKTFVKGIQNYDETIIEEIKGMARGSCFSFRGDPDH